MSRNMLLTAAKNFEDTVMSLRVAEIWAPNLGKQLKDLANTWAHSEDPLSENSFIKLNEGVRELGLKLLGEGRNRAVYLHRDWVIKVPINEAGLTDNSVEYSRYRKRVAKNLVPVARCRLWDPYLIMERVEPYTGSWKDLPDWTGAVDCAQVGYTRRGDLVAYDYGF